MLRGLIDKVVGDPNQREIQKLQPLVEAINALEPEVERKTEAELRALTDQFKARLAAGESLNDLLVEAFAAVREVAKRTVDMRPFDVQIIGGIVLHRGQVAEMRTGEGKTLVAAMPIYLNALLGRGAHLVTVNDYLARRDVLWMGPIYHTFGLTVGLLQSGAEQPAYLYDPDYQREPTTCATTWLSPWTAGSSAISTMPSWTRWTISLLTRPARRSSSPGLLASRWRSTAALPPSPASCDRGGAGCRRARDRHREHL